MLLSPFGDGVRACVFTAAELRAVKVHGRDPLLSSLQDRSGLMWSPRFIVITIRDNVNSLPTAGRWRRSALVLPRGPRCEGSAHVFGFPSPCTLDLWPKNFYLIWRNKKKTVICEQDTPGIAAITRKLLSLDNANLKGWPWGQNQYWKRK